MAQLSSGQPFAIDITPGVGFQDRASQVPYRSVFAGDDSMITGSAYQTPTTPQVNYLWYIFAVVLLLVGLKYASEHEKSGMEPRIVGIGVYNFVTVGIMAMLFLVVLKIGVNKFPVKGLTQLVNVA